MSNGDTSAEAIVRRFCEIWEERDLEGIMAMLSPDIVYQNVPGPIMRGHEEVRTFLAPFVEKPTKIEFILTAIGSSSDGQTILTERLDRLHYGDKVVDIPLMGIFVVKSGLIAAWRDYADSAHVGAQLAQL